MPVEIKCKDRFLQPVILRTNTATVRKGVRDYTLGPAVLVFDDGARVPIFIWRLGLRMLMALGDVEAIDCGYKSIQEMILNLAKVYPDIEPDQMMTIVDFKIDGAIQKGEVRGDQTPRDN